MSARGGTIVARVRVRVGAVQIVVASALIAFAAFVGARGVPGECGGDAPACPPGLGVATFALAAALFLLLPAGIGLAFRDRPELAPLAAALGFGGFAAGIWTSRFVADPVTTATSTTWWVSGVAAAVAMIAALVAVAMLRGGRDPDDRRAAADPE